MDSAGLTVIRDKMIEAGRQIQAVIHSVGSFASTKVLDASETEWRHSLEMNLDSVFRVSRIFLPTMLEQGVGNFVVVASAFGGRGPVSGFGVYGVAKAAVISLVRELAAEAAPFGVSVNSVSPGVLASPLLNAIPDYDKHADEIGRLFPLTNQVGDPAEIAKWVCSLATGELGWMTGQDVVVDGGFGCMPLFELAGIIP